ncbi:MAG: DUF3568 family protein [Elusimicrobia bacterium]|nr:DUF3568 family protein [Elusimicrobiota bacterium]
MRAGAGLRALSFLALVATAGLSGCAAAVPVAVAGAGSGISFTSTTAYRSFTYPQAQVHTAALQALRRMQIAKTKEKKSGEDIELKGKTKHLTIYITLAPITPTVTKASINAKRNWLMKDQTVAAEILIQMDQILGGADAAHPPH